MWTIIGVMVFIILLVAFLPLWIGIILFPITIFNSLFEKKIEKEEKMGKPYRRGKND